MFVADRSAVVRICVYMYVHLDGGGSSNSGNGGGDFIFKHPLPWREWNTMETYCEKASKHVVL